MSMLFPEEKEYSAMAEDAIWAVCDEFTWVLPAHLHGDKTPQENVTRIDLFAAQTATALVTAKYILRDRLNNRVVQRIDYELDRRIIQPFMNRNFWWEEKKNNWAAVCAGGVGTVFMYQRPELFCKVRKRIDGAMGCFLAGYNDDGFCMEGTDYWEFGFGNFCRYAEELRQFTGGEKNYFNDKKVKEIALYRQRVYMRENRLVSIADSTGRTSCALWLPCFLKTVYPGDAVVFAAEENVSTASLYDVACELIYYDKSMLTPYRQKEGTVYFENSGVFIRKTNNYSACIKAGNNDEPHNHNDVGSFAISVPSGDVLCDIGVGYYNYKYFSDSRYDIFCTSSQGHSVPVINGKGQRAGAEYNGKMRAVKNGAEVEFGGAYGIKELKSLKRRLEFYDAEIILTDTFDAAADCDVTERFISGVKPMVSGCCVSVGDAVLEYGGEWRCKISEHIHIAPGGGRITYYSMDFTPKAAAADFRMIIKTGGNRECIN